MSNAFAFFDTKNNAHCIVQGNYQALLQHGVPAYIQQTSVLSRFLFNLKIIIAKKSLSDAQDQLIKRITYGFNTPVTGLFIRSIDQKQKKWRGIFSTHDMLYMVKTFNSYEDSYHEATQTKIVEQHFSGPFIVPRVISCQDTILISHFIPKARSVQDDDGILDRLYHFTHRMIEESTAKKSAIDFLPINFPVTFAKLEDTILTKYIKEWLAQNNQQIPVTPIHGDMTPWNIYVDHQERIILNNFERAGWHVPLYDIFHYTLQPQALFLSKPKSVIPLIEKLPWESYPWLRTALILYLVDQLCCDLSDLHDSQHNDMWLQSMIKIKKYWLEELLED